MLRISSGRTNKKDKKHPGVIRTTDLEGYVVNITRNGCRVN